MEITLLELRTIIREAIDDDRDDFNDAVDELMKQPEMKSIEAFVEAKYDDDDETYGTLELQALARNLYLKDQRGQGKVHKHTLATAPAEYRERVKNDLTGYGLKFVPREKMKQHRGFTAPFHGTSGLKDMHGGSGFDNSFNTPKGPGTVWSAGDKSTLGMGAKRK